MPGSNLFDKLLSGIPFYSKLTPDYNITFNKTIHYFVSEELYDKFFSEAMMNLKNPKKLKLSLVFRQFTILTILIF